VVLADIYNKVELSNDSDLRCGSVGDFICDLIRLARDIMLTASLYVSTYNINTAIPGDSYDGIESSEI